jgi:hypothetical protein
MVRAGVQPAYRAGVAVDQLKRPCCGCGRSAAPSR